MICVTLLLLTLIQYSLGYEDCVLVCDDQWWTSYMDAYQHCDYDKIMEQYPSPLNRDCVNNLIGENGNKLISCLEEKQCFTDGEEWCESWTCDFYQCDRWNLCYAKQEELCNEEWEQCHQKCEEEHPKEEPDCVEEQCEQQMEGCKHEDTCERVVHHIDADNLCHEDTNGGNSCFDEVYQQHLCTEIAQQYGHSSDTSACNSALSELAVCYKDNCYDGSEEEHGANGEVDDEHWEPYDYYYHENGDHYYDDHDVHHYDDHDGYYDDHVVYDDHGDHGMYDDHDGSGSHADECHCDCSNCEMHQNLQTRSVRSRVQRRHSHRRQLRKRRPNAKKLVRRVRGRTFRGRRRLVHHGDEIPRPPGRPGPQYRRKRFTAARKRKFHLSAKLLKKKK